jgi:HAD superfamily hydrolase (TIGR01450 family)
VNSRLSPIRHVVIVGFDTTLTYERLCRAAYWISAGLPYPATHPDQVCPSERGTVSVDCGSICACLSAATGRTTAFLGKPDPSILPELSNRFRLTPAQIAVVGDRMHTDIVMAQRAGAMVVLVLTGETKTNEVLTLPKPPDLVVSDVGEFGEWLEKARVSGAVQ